MPDSDSFDYAIIRVVPKVERGEFLNIGVILFSRSKRFLGCKCHLDTTRLEALDPDLDVDSVAAHLDVLQQICLGGENAGPIGRLPEPERFHWLVAPRSTVIQPSPVHCGVSSYPQQALITLFERLVLLA